MDVRAVFHSLIKQMEWGEVLNTLQAVVEDALGLSSNCSSLPPPAPAHPTELGYDIYPQPVAEVHHHLNAPYSFQQPVTAAESIMQAGPLYFQADVHSQGQHTLYHSAVYDHPGPSTAAFDPEAFRHTYSNALEISFLESTGQNLVPLQVMNGEVVYINTLNHLSSASPTVCTSMSKRRKRKYDKPQDDEKPYIKKPLNAFMLFMKEQRQNVVTEINLRDNATVNTILGQRWALLSKKEKEKFYEKAEEERQLHARQHPGWSSSNNYGKKRKRQRCKAVRTAECKQIFLWITCKMGGKLNDM
ncbi:transcription factor 7-like 2 [Channa argus]